MISRQEIKRLRKLQQRKFREQEGAFIVEGEKGVQEALDSTWEVLQVYATADWKGDHPSLIRLKQEDMDQISSMNTAPPVLALVKIKVDAKISGDHLVYLDGIRDPGNLGTIIRLCDWFGVDTLMLRSDCVETLNPKVVQASMGSVFRVNVVESVDVNDLLALSEKGYSLVAADMNGENLSTYEMKDKWIWVFGNESHGISQEIRDAHISSVKIEGDGGAESLNVATAAAIVLYECCIRKQEGRV